ncbi:hypothetical protein [Streptomyces sp. NPDC058985]|uniref:hypothetical protein n=1 Tax=Streptomyces sp. NPDC058985 TaxID=3346684 RepID=UPI0036C77B25
MFNTLTLAIGITASLLALWCTHAAWRDQPTKDWHFVGMALVTLLTFIQLVAGVWRLAAGDRPVGGTVTFLSYLLGALVAVPAAGMLSLAERTRWGSFTVMAGAFVLAFLEVRLYDIWAGPTA